MIMHFRVAVGEWVPFLNLRTDEGGVLQMSGPLSDIFELIAEHVNFTYTLYRSKGDSWGIYGPNGWTGMLGMLDRDEADLAIGPFTLSYARWSAFATSVPIFIDHVEILVPVFEWKRSLFNMLTVFSCEVWLMVFITVLVLSFTITVTDENGRQNFVIEFYRNLWVVSGTLLQEGRVKRPRTYPYAILMVFWMIGNLVLANMFSGVVLTNLLLRKSRTIDSIYDVIASPDILPILEPQSSIFGRFQEGTADMYRSVFKKVNQNPEKCILTYKEMSTVGMDLVMSGSFALITDAMGLKSFLAHRYEEGLPCKFRLAREPLWNLWKVVAFRKNFPKELIRQVNRILRYTLETGWLEQRMKNEFLSYQECISSDQAEVQSLKFEHTLGTFVILCIGLVASILVLIAEILLKRSRTASSRSKRKRILKK